MPRFQLESCVAQNSDHQIHQAQAGDARAQQDDHSYRCAMSLAQLEGCGPGRSVADAGDAEDEEPRFIDTCSLSHEYMQQRIGPYEY